MENTNLEKLAEQYYQEMKMQDLGFHGQKIGIPRTHKEREAQYEGFKNGFKMCEQILQNKLFTKNDMINFACQVFNANDSFDKSFKNLAKKLIENFESNKI